MAESLDNQLRDFEDGVKVRNSLITTFIAIVAFASPLVTVTSFKDFAGLKADVWNALYVLATIAALAWWVRKAAKLGYDVYKKRLLTRDKFLQNLLDQSRLAAGKQ